MVVAVLDDGHRDRFRIAMRFSLWMWALYWPGGGLLLLLGGLDPISIVVTLLGVGGLVLMLRSGALKSDASRTMKQFMLERPMYLIGALFLFILFAPFFSPLEELGLRLFSLAWLASTILVLVRLHQWARADGLDVRASGADQVYILQAMVTFAAFMVFIDAWLPMFGAEPVAGPLALVAAVSWMGLLYPALLLLTTRGLRDELTNPFRRSEPDPEADTEPGAIDESVPA